MFILHWADYAVFGSLLLISVLVGPFYMWKDRNKLSTSESYFAGDRNLQILPTAASLFISFWSAISLIGIPAELYKGGAKFFVVSFGQAVGILIAAFVAVPVIYKLRLISSYEYFELRFRSTTLRTIGTICNFLASIAYLAVVTYAPCISLAAVTPIPLWASIIGTATVTMIYTVLGGIKAVVVVDLLQSTVMFSGVIIGIAVGFSKIDGGFLEALKIADNGGRLDFFDFDPDPTNTYNFWIMVFPAVFATAGIYSTSQIAVQRYSALPSLKLAKIAVVAMAPQIIVLTLMLFFMSIAMFAFYDNLGCHLLAGKVIDNENQLTTFYMAQILDVPGLMGLWFAAIFSGSLSSMSTGYNSAAACLWEDILKNMKFADRLSKRQVSLLLKLITLSLGLSTCILALLFQYIEGSIIQLTNSTVAVFGAAIYIAFFNGVLLPMTNATGTISGMVFSTFFIIFVAGGQMLFSLGNQVGKDINYQLPTANCSSMIAELVLSGRYQVGNGIKAVAIGDDCAVLLRENKPKITVDKNESLAISAEHFLRFMKNGAKSDKNVTNSTPNCKSNVTITELGGGGGGEEESFRDRWRKKLPRFLEYTFSISYFIFPFLSLIFGTIISISVSLCTGGLQFAKTVHPRYMIVPNCFYEKKQSFESVNLEDMHHPDNDQNNQSKDAISNSSETHLEDADGESKHC